MRREITIKVMECVPCPLYGIVPVRFCMQCPYFGGYVGFREIKCKRDKIL